MIVTITRYQQKLLSNQNIEPNISYSSQYDEQRVEFYTYICSKSGFQLKLVSIYHILLINQGLSQYTSQIQNFAACKKEPSLSPIWVAHRILR